VLTLLVLFLWPTLALPYLGDDMFNAYLDGWIGYEHLSTSQAFVQYLAIETHSARFYPVFAVSIFAMFHFLNNLLVLKVLVLVAILGNVATFYWLLRFLSPRIALLAVVLLPLTWQIRFFHDPIIQFSLHMQITLEFILLGFVGLAAFLKTGRGRYLASGSASYLLACMSYEPVYAYVVPYIAVALFFGRHPKKRTLAATAFVLPALACGVIVYALRVRFPLSATDQHAFGWAVDVVLRTFWNQALGALPLSYLVANPSGIFTPNSLPWQPADVAIGVLALLAGYKATGHPECGPEPVWGGERRRALLATAFVAVLAWLVPGIAIAFSPRWQSQVQPGLPYLPVYLAEPAVALLLALCIFDFTIVRRTPFDLGRYAAACVCALGILTTYRVNAFAMAHFTPWNMTVPDALDAGILRDAAVGDIVYLDSSYPAHAQRENDPGDAKYYLYKHVGKRLIPKTLAELPPSGAAGSFLLLGTTEGFDGGVVVAGRIAGIEHDAQGFEPMFEDFERYVRTPGNAPTLTKWTSRCGPVRADRALEGMPSVLPPLEFRGPFSYRERDRSGSWRWLSGAGEVGISNPTTLPIEVRLTFAMRAIAAGRTVSATGPGFRAKEVFRGSDVAVAETIKIAPRITIWVSLDANGPPLTRPPDPRRLLLQIRDLTVTEPACVDGL
jgi:hypothetical protein